LVHKPRLKSRPAPIPERPPAVLLAGIKENAPVTLMTVAVETFNPGITVPNLRGMSLRSAIATVKKFGLTPRVEGSGAVVYQWPIAGTEVSPGSTCSIKLN